jgi:hypothetical protein
LSQKRTEFHRVTGASSTAAEKQRHSLSEDISNPDRLSFARIRNSFLASSICSHLPIISFSVNHDKENYLGISNRHDGPAPEALALIAERAIQFIEPDFKTFSIGLLLRARFSHFEDRRSQ